MKLALIAALAPLGVLVAVFLVVGKGNPQFLFIVLAYPPMLVATLILGFPLHSLFRRWQLRPSIQALVIVVAGLVGGFLVTLLVMTPDLGKLSEYPTLFIRDARGALYFFGFWTSWGVATGLMAWLLYNFGPLRINSPQPPGATVRAP